MYVNLASEKTFPAIYGFAGSTAEIYAETEGMEFIALLEYDIIEGADSSVAAGEGIKIRANGDLSKFESVTIDGLTVDPSNYKVSSSNMVIDFSKDFVSALTAGVHYLTLFFADGIASTSMTVTPDLFGDITSDGNVNIGDVARLYAHIKGTSLLTDENVTDLCDITGDGKVNIGDVAKLYAHIKVKSTLDRYNQYQT
jgi:hypothetical protein